MADMGFVYERLAPRAAILTKHFRQFESCTTAAAFERQLFHFAFDWDANHRGYRRKRCVAVGVINRSRCHDLKLTRVTVHSGRECQTLRKQLASRASHTSNISGTPSACNGQWRAECSTVVFAMGEPPVGHTLGIDSGGVDVTVETTAGRLFLSHSEPGARFVALKGLVATFTRQATHEWFGGAQF